MTLTPPMTSFAQEMPWRDVTYNSFLSGALRGLKQRNTAADHLFYDVCNLSKAEQNFLVDSAHREGSILIVLPRGARGEESVVRRSDLADLMSASGAKLERFAIAGVGSSDLGSASFARTLADYFQEPVGAIVSGYGVADLMTEALGGWFVFGGVNRLLDRQARVDKELFASGSTTTPSTTTTALSEAELGRRAEKAGLDDVLTLYRLFKDTDRRIKSIAGHSKGALLIDTALEALVRLGERGDVERLEKMQIITASCIVNLPDNFTQVLQLMGSFDQFGRLNSSTSKNVEYTAVAGAFHHLNTRLPGHLDLMAALKEHLG